MKRGVILAGGFGTRCLPATKSTNKHKYTINLIVTIEKLQVIIMNWDMYIKDRKYR